MANKKIVVEFLGESKDLQNAIGDVDSKSSKLSGTLGKVGKAAAIGLGVGVVVGAKALAGMTKNAIEDEAAQRKLAIGLKNATGATDEQIASVEEWISAQGKALGITDDEMRPALQRLAESTGSVEEAQRQMKIAMDVSAGTGKSLQTVTEAMMKANNGSIAGLSRLGLKTKDAAGNTLTLDQAMASMADTFEGQAAAKANTLEGKMDRLKLIFDETKETIGSKLIPVLTTMADWFLNQGLPAIMAFGGWLSDHIPPIFEKVKAVISAVMGAVQGDVGGGLGQVQAIFTDVTSIITSLWNTFGATIIEYATTAFAAVQQIIGGALTIVQGIFQTFSALLQGDWSGAWEGIKLILSGAWDVIQGIVTAAFNLLKTGFEIGWTALKGIVDLAWEGIKTLVSNGIGKVVDFVQAIPGKFTTALSDLKSTAEGLFDKAMDAAKTKVTDIGGAIVTWVGGVPGKFTTALADLLSTVRGLFDDAMTAGKTKVTDIGDTIVGWIAGIPGKLVAKLADFKQAGADLIGGVVDGMKNAAGIIEGIAGNVWAAVRSMLNGAIDKINAALEFTIEIPGPNISINPPDIPHMAKGGIVNRPTLALIGEDGPEAVVPLSAKHAPRGGIPGLAGSGGGNFVVQIYGPIDPMGTVAALEKHFQQYARNVGRPVAIGG